MKTRQIIKNFRVDPNENRMLKEKARESNSTEADFLRNCILNRKPSS